MNYFGNFSFYSFGSSLRQSLLFDFGVMLMSHESFWLFGIDYLEQCSIEGNGAIELFLTRMNFKSEKNVLKVLNVVRDKGYVDVGKFLNVPMCRFIIIKSILWFIYRKRTVPCPSTKEFQQWPIWQCS